MRWHTPLQEGQDNQACYSLRDAEIGLNLCCYVLSILKLTNKFDVLECSAPKSGVYEGRVRKMLNDRLVAQMAAYFLHKQKGRMPILKLMKLLYLADRESMDRYGYPMSYDYMVSMQHGPVLSGTLNLINDFIESSDDGWKDWISDRANHEVDLIKDQITIDDLDELSVAEIEVLDAIWERFGHMGKYALRDYTHDHCAEWRDPRGSSRQIEYKDVFQALGKSEEQAVALQAEILSKQSVDDLFASL